MTPDQYDRLTQRVEHLEHRVGRLEADARNTTREHACPVDGRTAHELADLSARFAEYAATAYECGDADDPDASARSAAQVAHAYAQAAHAHVAAMQATLASDDAVPTEPTGPKVMYYDAPDLQDLREALRADLARDCQ